MENKQDYDALEESVKRYRQYHTYVDTSNLYQEKLNDMRDNVDDIYKFVELEKELILIDSVLREVCGLRPMRHGEIKNNEE